MKRILVPFDFSKPAISALRFALDLAERGKTKIHVVHIIELPVMADGIIVPVLTFEEQLLNDLRDKAELEYEKIQKKYLGNRISPQFTVDFGHVLGSIERYIAQHDIDLVVIGSHGASGLRELFLGSNAQKLVRRSPVPVVVLKEYYRGPIKNIVFPITLDDQDQFDLIEKVKSLQHTFEARLQIVWINTPLNFSNDSVTLQKMEEFASTHKLKDYSLHVFNHSNEEKGIIEFSSRINGDLIAIGTHGRRGVVRLLNGSIAEDVVNHGKGLIWTYNMKGEEVSA